MRIRTAPNNPSALCEGTSPYTGEALGAAIIYHFKVYRQSEAACKSRRLIFWGIIQKS